MKRNELIIKGIAVSIFTISIIFSSCSTERIEPENEKVEYEEADEYLDSKKTEEQEYEITQEGDGPLIGKEGTKIWLSKDILQYPNGDSVQFPYTIKLVELYSPKDMIYYQMPSMSGSNLLTTHGEIRVRAFKNNTELILRDNKFWITEIPNNSPKNNMICYYGNENSNIVDWINAYDTPFSINGSFYHGEIIKLGWISCAQEAIGSEQTIKYTFYSDSISLNNLTTFIYLPQQEGLMQVYNKTSSELPIGATIKITSLAKQGEQLFSFYLEETVSDFNQVEINLSSTTDSQYTAILDNL